MNQTRALNTSIKISVIILTILVLLLGVYLAGDFILPGSIKASYQRKNCEQVLSLSQTYSSLYPGLLADQSIADITRECGLYSFALEKEQAKAWQDAYNGYQSYKQSYPHGLFAGEVDDNSAQILVNWAKDDLAAKKYNDATGKIDTVLKNYSTTKVGSEAASLMSDVYMASAKGQRTASDFAGAETTLKAFSAWATDAKKNEYVKSAQRELALTYFMWGLAFQGQKKFEDARSKLDLAISTDPEPLAKTGTAADAKAAKIRLYLQWGDSSIQTKDFDGALERYQTVIPLSEGRDQAMAKDGVAEVNMSWAASLAVAGDFIGALKKMDEATQAAGSNGEKSYIEIGRTGIYKFFSKSTGSQAIAAMKGAIKDVCEKNKKPTLPIFGLDKEHIQAGIYGIDDKLPDNLVAQTPGALHYVACIEIQTTTVQTMTFYIAKFVREQYTWNVTLRSVEAPETIIGTTSITGGVPPEFPPITRANYMSYLLGSLFYRSRGSNPDVLTLSNWMLTLMK